jgi:hypothetical protein
MKFMLKYLVLYIIEILSKFKYASVPWNIPTSKEYNEVQNDNNLSENLYYNWFIQSDFLLVILQS